MHREWPTGNLACTPQAVSSMSGLPACPLKGPRLGQLRELRLCRSQRLAQGPDCASQGLKVAEVQARHELSLQEGTSSCQRSLLPAQSKSLPAVLA